MDNTKTFSERIGKSLLFFDGGYGTLLQSRGLPAGLRPEVWNVTHPDRVRAVHREYLDAGADILKTNTFGANALHFPGEYGYTLSQIVRAGVENARAAAKDAEREAFVALDIGPCGKLVGTDLDFEDAVSLFSETVKCGADGCDLVLLETFGNLAEMRAALLAVRENCDLPVVLTCVCDAAGRTFTGTPVEVVCKVAKGLGASAVGMNCSQGPIEMRALLPRLLAATDLPLCLNPNAGLPKTRQDGSTFYDISAEEFASELQKTAAGGVSLLGGCCGTTPDFIRALTKACKGIKPQPRDYTPVCEAVSATRIVPVGAVNVTVIGERLNPTGKPKLKDALRRGDVEYLVGEALSEEVNGAAVLDVNVGLPEIDEKEMLTRTVERVQKATPLPLQLDTADAEAMEAALRRYHGLALINSVNGGEKSLAAVLPLVKKYGGTVIGLTLDENGIPDTPEGRYAIAERIVGRCASLGIGRERIIIDPLTLTLGSDPHSADKTIAAMRLIQERLGVKTSLGVSNISFGLPDREKVNCDFLSAAKAAGLSAAIMNPGCAPMMAVAAGEDNSSVGTDTLAEAANRAKNVAADTSTLQGCILAGLSARAKTFAETLCGQKEPVRVISEDVIPALNTVGAGFEKGTIFLPGLMAAAEAAIAALGAVTSRLPAGEGSSQGKVVLATVEGDVHDIGKNIVSVMLRSYGFDVTDLGKNVPAQAVADAVKATGAALVGLSALMTTTVPSMERTVALLHKDCPGVRVVVGGAVLTADYAKKIGADAYAADAMATVRIAKEVYSK